MLLEQKLEQHSPPDVHGLPSVLQEVLSGVHVPFEPHVPLQHCAFVVQAALSPVQVGGWHEPLAQLPEQQSTFVLHWLPRGVQLGFPSPKRLESLPPLPSVVGPPSPVVGLSPPSVPSFPPSSVELESPPHAAGRANSPATRSTRNKAKRRMQASNRPSCVTSRALPTCYRVFTRE